MIKLTIYEPMTTITDLLIMVAGVWFALELQELYNLKLMNVHWHFNKAMWMVALAGLFGAISHGAGTSLSPKARVFVWRIILLSIGLTSTALVLASLYHVFPYDTVVFLRWIMVGIMVWYAIGIYRDHHFIRAVKFYIPSMFFLLIVMIYSWHSLQNPGANLLVWGVLVAFLGSGIQISGFSLHKYFNHNDIYHIIQIGSMYLLYRGALLVHDYSIG